MATKTKETVQETSVKEDPRQGVKSVRFYQSVTFGGGTHTSISEAFIKGKPLVTLSLNESLGLIELLEQGKDRDHILVPLANVSAIHLWTDAGRTKDDETRDRHGSTEPFGVRLSEIKRPR